MILVENLFNTLKKKANLENNFLKLEIDLKKDYSNIISGVNILRLSNNPVELKKEDFGAVLQFINFR